MPKEDEVQLPEAGLVYGFKTKPRFEWGPQDTGRYGAFKFIGIHNETTPVVLVYDGVFNQMPTLDQVKTLPILKSNRFSFNDKPEISGMFNYDPAELDALFIPLGKLSVSAAETDAAINCRSFSGLRGVDASLECEWLWEHQREQFKADVARQQAEDAARYAAQEAYYKTRLKGLTFETLLSETLFENWTPSPPFPPAAFITEARALLRALMTDLQALKPKPKKAQARKAIKAAVEALNAADMKYGHVIETGEREDLCEALTEIAHAAKHPKLADEVDDWREW